MMPFLENLPQNERLALQEQKRMLLILWRYDQKKARFTWLNVRLTGQDSSAVEHELQLDLEAHIKGTAKLDYQATLNSL
ncbi:unnamed protein product, partial [Gongylonema pulchrum]|uniref:Diguanylate cyclase n=1 Tax=Gongylonema pulchrum TaxID=637853 RepID=A0A183EZ49_9BILA